ncbi:lysoplasmalogenase family protein [Sphingopyxis sp. JAI128]|uniref:lysoplasmalogenase family protein n=1 Tax=Sphingopyxis sp. JAI128 TaxID=2723066 RepID=UPI00161D495B|nr:lysoplasmalogenase family protein [Sphingopyxis sp. JAI128]MBB6424893.1 putative membrane protein YhhN [Sphingopyxis sp. JAI128]
MTTQQNWDRARWLWWLALLGGVSFFAVVYQRLDGPTIWAWKASGVGLLALWAAANARGKHGWMIAATLAFGALGDWLLDAKGLETGAVAFVIGHIIAIALYLMNRRPRLTSSQRLLVWLTMPATLAIVWGMLSPAPGWWHAALYSLFVAAMAAAAWTSRFPRYRAGIGAMLFLASDLFIFAGEGGALSNDITQWLVWPLYFGGQTLIAWGVVSTLARETV